MAQNHRQQTQNAYPECPYHRQQTQNAPLKGSPGGPGPEPRRDSGLQLQPPVSSSSSFSYWGSSTEVTPKLKEDVRRPQVDVSSTQGTTLGTGTAD